jgi:hypothetical protein
LDPLEKVLRPIIEGQVRSFANDHPEVVEAVTWFKPRADKKVTFVNSVTKRILRDLLCPTSRARLRAALVEDTAASAEEDDTCHRLVGASGGGVALATAPSPNPAEAEIVAASAHGGGVALHDCATPEGVRE